MKLLGPGLITGASDDDPSGIATYSQAGAQFGFSPLWTMVLTFPLMASIQRISATIGRVTGHGIAGNMRRNFPATLTLVCVSLMVAANTINVAADITAIGAAVQLLIGGPRWVYAAVLAVGSLVVQIKLPYSRYVHVLKWLTLALFAYAGTVLAVKIPWNQALRGLIVPSISFNKEFLTMLAALFGTTISPYLLFWQASLEVEETKIVKEDKPLVKAPEQGRAQLARIEWDTNLGMAFSNVIALFIMITTAATLHAHGTTNIETAAQAAEALRPVAGRLAFLFFSLGIIGTGLLALPVLAGSAAYGIGEALNWRTGLEARPHRARKFYWTLSLVMLAGLGLSWLQVNPIKALFWTAVLNGIVSPPIMVILMLLASRPKPMESWVISRPLQVAGWTATVLMFAVAIASIVSWF